MIADLTSGFNLQPTLLIIMFDLAVYRNIYVLVCFVVIYHQVCACHNYI